MTSKVSANTYIIFVSSRVLQDGGVDSKQCLWLHYNMLITSTEFYQQQIFSQFAPDITFVSRNSVAVEV
jgi:hypothetical protein